MRHKRSSQKKPDPALVVALQRLRREYGWTQEALAIEANLTIATLSRVERGVTDPAWSSIRAIVKALGISLDELGAAVELEDSQCRELRYRRLAERRAAWTGRGAQRRSRICPAKTTTDWGRTTASALR